MNTHEIVLQETEQSQGQSCLCAPKGFEKIIGIQQNVENERFRRDRWPEGSSRSTQLDVWPFSLKVT